MDGRTGSPPGLPPIHTTPRRSKSRRRKGAAGSLATTSLPLTPEAGLHGLLDPRGPGDVHGDSAAAAAELVRPPAQHGSSRLSRRNAQSDTGQCSSSGSATEPAQQLPQQPKQAQRRPSAGGEAAASSSGSIFSQRQQEQQQPPAQREPALQQQPLALADADASSGSRAATPSQQPPAAAQLSALRQSSVLQPCASLDGLCPAPPPSLWSFIHAEATPHEKYPTADVLWRQTERDRVYNFLLYVPYQLERIMLFGTALCLYSFLGALTVLPLRCLRALWQLGTRLLLPGGGGHGGGGSRGGGRRSPLLPGAQLYDVLCVCLLLGAVAVLAQIRPGVIYYWMKDITSEFLKIQVLFTALEILDKILSNFGVDVLEALSSTCTLFTRARIGLPQLLCDVGVAFGLITAHGSVLMCQAMVFAVTMNSKRNALLALMIGTNFVELKGQVYKRTDTNKLWTLACQDIVERFELLLVLGFVVVEDISNSGTWWPAPATLLECGRIFLWEIVIDISKHAVLGKFNDIRPGIYREYMRDLCADSLDNHSHNTHKLVGFCPLGPAALCLRMAHTLVTLKGEGAPHWGLRLALLGGAWLCAAVAQVGLGYSLKWGAWWYVRHHALQAGGKTLPRAINVSPAGIKLVAAAAAAGAAAAPKVPAAGPGGAAAGHSAAAAAAAASGLASPSASPAASKGAVLGPGALAGAVAQPSAAVSAAAAAAAAAGAPQPLPAALLAPGSRLGSANTRSDDGGSRPADAAPPSPAGGSMLAGAAGSGDDGAWLDALPLVVPRVSSSPSSPFSASSSLLSGGRGQPHWLSPPEGAGPRQRAAAAAAAAAALAAAAAGGGELAGSSSADCPQPRPKGE